MKPTIVGIDMEKLKRTQKTKISSNGHTMKFYDTNTDKWNEISHIQVFDEVEFNVLTVGVNITNNIKKYYCYLDISVVGKYGNLVPSSIKQFKDNYKKTLEYINRMYGIELDVNGYKCESVEFNATIRTDREFKEYRYLLECLGACGTGGKKKFKLSNNYTKSYELECIKLWNKSMELKIYDKSRQLNEVKETQINDNYMRFEYTLKVQSTIERMLGTSELENITDTQIKSFILENLKKDLFDKYDDYLIEANKQLMKIAKKQRKLNTKTWGHKLLNNAITEKITDKPLLLDFTQIENILKELTRDSYNCKKLLTNITKNLELQQYQDNLIKLEEIKGKIEML